MSNDFTSIKQLAKRLGVARTTATKWLGDSRFPLQREAPWSEDDAKEIEVWRATVLQPNRAAAEYKGKTTEPPRDQQTKDFWLMRRYRAMALEQEGRLIDTDTVQREVMAMAIEARDHFLQIPNSAQGLLGLTDEQAKQLDGHIRQVLDGLADRMEQKAEQYNTISADQHQLPTTPTA